MSVKKAGIAAQLDGLNEHQLRRLLIEHLTKQKVGLNWEHSLIERDQALNADVVLPRLDPELSLARAGSDEFRNLIIEGDNFDALRLLKATHANKIRVIYIDPPYNTGNTDWVYNDKYVGKNDRWRHSQWLEFLYQRLLLARDLLTPDGVILVSINDENRARLELLMDEVFPSGRSGPEFQGGRLGSLAWRTKDTGNDLSQRFSHVHEHVLVYAGEAFRFNGRPTDRKKFRNGDQDVRGDWSHQPLTKGHTYKDREQTYYPIQNPETGYWYPCDPDSVWRFASEKKIRQRLGDDAPAVAKALAGLRSETIEALIADKMIFFPSCKESEVMRFKTKEELLAAIRAGRGPMLPKKKTPLLRAELPDLDFWIDKPIAPGRPSRKEHWLAKPEEDRIAPLSSWIAGMNEDVGEDEDGFSDLETLRSTRGGVATEEIKKILGSKAFPYPKPLSLIQGLLEQATRPGDIVLDFFAGSGTTGHAVLALNQLDGGNRRFVLCSSTEATLKEPGKNLCRDICAERIRRVINGYGSLPGVESDYAYIKLDLLSPADVRLDATPENVFQHLSLLRSQAARPLPEGPVKIIAQAGDLAVAYLTEVTSASIQALIDLPQVRLAVYSSRPQTVAERLESSGKIGNSYSIWEALMAGQNATQGASA